MAYLEDFVKAIREDIDYRITLLSGQGLVVEGFKSLLYYSETHIELKVIKAILMIDGENLIVKEVAGRLLILQGSILKIEVKPL